MLGHPLVQLTLVRIREFVREPEAVFWAIFFPILLTTGLGIAFRSRPPEVLKVAGRRRSSPQAIRSEAGLSVENCRPTRRAQALRVGRCRCSSSRATADGVVYRYDETNPEGRDRARAGRPALSSGPPDGRIRSPPRTRSCASRDRATSTSWCRAWSGSAS